MSKVSCLFEDNAPAPKLVSEFRQITGVDEFDVAVILGSGWSSAVEIGPILGSVDYKDWSCFPSGQISGHPGRLFAVEYASCHVLFFSGRFHCYQGLSAFQASFPVQLAAAFGCREVLLTCATGGINPRLSPGDYMFVEDHLNFLGDNPLKGLQGDMFVDMSAVYDTELYDLFSCLNGGASVVHRGILASMSGPSYETPAEIRFLENAGADVVSMSTVPEAIMARYLEMKVAAIAFVANYAAGKSSAPLSHQDVLECSEKNMDSFPDLMRKILDCWCQINQ